MSLQDILRRAALRAQAQRACEVTSGWMPGGMLGSYDEESAKPQAYRGLLQDGFPSPSQCSYEESNDPYMAIWESRNRLYDLVSSRKETKRGRPPKTSAQREAYRIVGKNIERRMQGKEWTQEYLAGRVGVDVRTVQRHIKGEVSPRTHLDAYCRELGCSREELTTRN